jgi:hypothetical protein
VQQQLKPMALDVVLLKRSVEQFASTFDQLGRPGRSDDPEHYDDAGCRAAAHSEGVLPGSIQAGPCRVPFRVATCAVIMRQLLGKKKTALGEAEGRKVFDAPPDTPITQRIRLSFRRAPAVAWQG